MLVYKNGFSVLDCSVLLCTNSYRNTGYCLYYLSSRVRRSLAGYCVYMWMKCRALSVLGDVFTIAKVMNLPELYYISTRPLKFITFYSIFFFFLLFDIHHFPKLFKFFFAQRFSEYICYIII